MPVTAGQKCQGIAQQPSPYAVSRPPVEARCGHSSPETEDNANVAGGCGLPLDLLGLDPTERAKRLRSELDRACSGLEEQHEITMTAMDALRRMQIADSRRRPEGLASLPGSKRPSTSSGRLGSTRTSSSRISARCCRPVSGRSCSRDSGTGQSCRPGMTPRAMTKEGLDQAFSTYLPHLAPGRKKAGDFHATSSSTLTGAKDTIRTQLETIKLLKNEQEKKCALKCLLVTWHPDKNQANPELATSAFQFIQSERTRLKI